jgi:hypothetical protein
VMERIAPPGQSAALISSDQGQGLGTPVGYP